MICRWVKVYRKDDVEGLNNKIGRPSTMNLDKKNRITQKIGKRNEKIAQIIYELRENYPLKDLLKYLSFPKSIYMYWQKRLNREKNKEYKKR